MSEANVWLIVVVAPESSVCIVASTPAMSSSLPFQVAYCEADNRASGGTAIAPSCVEFWTPSATPNSGGRIKYHECAPFGRADQIEYKAVLSRPNSEFEGLGFRARSNT